MRWLSAPLIAVVTGSIAHATVAQTANHWLVQRSTGGTEASSTVVLSRAADAGSDPWLRQAQLVLTLRCRRGSTEAMIASQEPIRADQGGVADYAARLQFDDAQPVAQTWSKSVSGLALFARQPQDFIEALARSRRLRFDVTRHRAPPVVAVFELAGLRDLVEPLETACGWSRQQIASAAARERAARADTLARKLARAFDSVVAGDSNYNNARTFDVREVDRAPVLVSGDGADGHLTLLKNPHAAGTAIARFVVDDTGAVHRAVVESPSGREFAAAALEAIKNRRYSPALKGGRRVNARLSATFVFP